MGLTLKHAAIFGRIHVDIQDYSDCSFYKTKDVYTMYKEGWWVTERFGNRLCMVRKRTNGQFMNRFYPFKTDVNLDTLDLLWEQIKTEKEKQYHNYLFGKERKKYTYKKVTLCK